MFQNMKVRKNSKTMFGFSLEELLLLFAVCFLVLGPRKTVEMAYRLGIQAGKVKNYYDSCKREFGLADLESVKNSFTQNSADMVMKINSVSASLKNAMKSDAASEHPSDLCSAYKEKTSYAEPRHKQASETQPSQEKTSKKDDPFDDENRKALELRIASLEAELENVKSGLLLIKKENPQ